MSFQLTLWFSHKEITMTDSTHKFEKLRDIINDIKVAMFVTSEGELQLRARPMFTVDIDSNHNIWFFTNDDSGKVAEIINDHHVNLTYACPDDGKYLSVSGRANLIDDSKRKHELFSYFNKAWFPQGADDPNLLLIKVDPSDAEYWDTSGNSLVQLFKIAKAIAKEETYEGGEHEKIQGM